MPLKNGEMNVRELRDLARQHNKLTTIMGIDKLTRAKLISEIQRMGYTVDHKNMRLKKVSRGVSVVKVSEQAKAKKVKKQPLPPRKELLAMGLDPAKRPNEFKKYLASIGR